MEYKYSLSPLILFLRTHGKQMGYTSLTRLLDYTASLNDEESRGKYWPNVLKG